MDHQSGLYWIWFSCFPFLRLKTRTDLLTYFNGPEGVFSAGESELRRFRGLSADHASLICSTGLDRVERIIGDCEKQKIDILPFDDPRYPFRLKNIYSPPPVLYVTGVVPAVDEFAVISVIGTRKASQYGLRMGKRLSYEIVRCGGYVVSLLTAGVDRSAAEGALLAGDRCIGVLGTSHELEHGPLADEIIEKGALISEYAPGTIQLRSFFRDRNRVAAGLSSGVVVVEAPEMSGTRYFVNEALDQGKDIFAVPGNADSDKSIGTLDLLKMGARPVGCGWDVLSEYAAVFPDLHYSSDRPDALADPSEEVGKAISDAPEKKAPGSDPAALIEWKRKTASLSDEQSALVALIERGISVIDELIVMSGLSAHKVLSAVTMLEIKGVIVRDLTGNIKLNKHF